MSNEILSTQEYLNSLNGAKINFSNEYKEKKKNSFWKDFFAIIIVLGILSYFFLDKKIFDINAITDPVTSIQGSGDYVCSSEISDAADRLKPTGIPSDTTMLELNNEITRLNNEKVAIEAEATRVKSNLGQSSSKRDSELLQIRIDKYTQDVQAFNNKSARYRAELDEYNEKVKDYNKYIQENCEKSRN